MGWIDIDRDYKRLSQVYYEAAMNRALNVAERILVASKPVVEFCFDLYERAAVCWNKIADYTSQKVECKKKTLLYAIFNKPYKHCSVIPMQIDS